MAPFFTFFVDKEKSHPVAPYIKTLDKYYPSFVDSDIEPLKLKKKYDGSNTKFFAFDLGELVMYDLETVDLIPPLVAISMDSFTKMSNKNWITIFKFLKQVFAGDVEYDIEEETKKLVPKPIPQPEKIILHKSIEAPKELPQEYNFNFEIVDDICFAEIVKPYTDRPYTCVIRNFDQTGFEPLFTAVYVSQSWGVTNHDHLFLVKLWKYLNMDGELNLEERLKNEIELCKNGKPEPELYRAPIYEVKSLLSKKNKPARELDPNKVMRL